VGVVFWSIGGSTDGEKIDPLRGAGRFNGGDRKALNPSYCRILFVHLQTITTNLGSGYDDYSYFPVQLNLHE
jgi:hypothetical protein